MKMRLKHGYMVLGQGFTHEEKRGCWFKVGGIIQKC